MDINIIIDTSLFSSEQLKAIKRYSELGLSKEQIKVLANPGFTILQMYVIYESFCREFSVENVSLFAKPEFDTLQMMYIRDALKKIDTSIIMPYIDKEYAAEKMNYIFKALEYKMSKNKVEIIADKKYNFYQSSEIFNAFKENLPFERINKFMCDETFTGDQMHIICSGLKSELTDEQMDLFVNSKYSNKQMKIAVKYLDAGIDNEILSELLDDDYNYEQLNEICQAIIEGMCEENVELLKNKYLPPQAIYGLKKAMDNNVDKKYFDLISQPLLNAEQRLIIREGLQNETVCKYVYLYAKHYIPTEKMQVAYKMLSNGVSPKDIEYLLTKLENTKVFGFVARSINNGYSTNDIQTYLDNFSEKDKYLDSSHVKYIMDAIKEKASVSKLKFLANNNLTKRQARIISNAILEKYPDKKLSILANPNIKEEQMKSVKRILKEYDFDIASQFVEIIKENNLNPDEINELESSIQHGLLMDDIKKIATYSKANSDCTPANFKEKIYEKEYEKLENDYGPFSIEQGDIFKKAIECDMNYEDIKSFVINKTSIKEIKKALLSFLNNENEHDIKEIISEASDTKPIKNNQHSKDNYEER